MLRLIPAMLTIAAFFNLGCSDNPDTVRSEHRQVIGKMKPYTFSPSQKYLLGSFTAFFTLQRAKNILILQPILFRNPGMFRPRNHEQLPPKAFLVSGDDRMEKDRMKHVTMILE